MLQLFRKIRKIMYKLFLKRFIFGILPLLQQDSVEQTGREVGEREGGRIRKGPPAGIQTQDARNATVLYVGALPTRLSRIHNRMETMKLTIVNMIRN